MYFVVAICRVTAAADLHYSKLFHRTFILFTCMFCAASAAAFRSSCSGFSLSKKKLCAKYITTAPKLNLSTSRGPHGI
jgi:hypothetical protein